MTLKKMRGLKPETVTKPGWEALVTVRKFRKEEKLPEAQNITRSMVVEAWRIRFNKITMDRWFLIRTSKGYFLTRHGYVLKFVFIGGTPQGLVRFAITDMAVFWRDVITEQYEGKDPQCEECMSNSPVAHYPFTRSHRIHCTCSECF